MKNKKTEGFLRSLPLLLCLSAAVVYIALRLSGGQALTPEAIADIAPENELLCFLFIMLLAAFKSLSVFFPFFIIELISVFCFPRAVSMLVSAAALAVSFSVAYLTGRFSGSGFENRLCVKYPKFARFQSVIKSHDKISIFALRIIGILPMDLVGMYFGAMKTRFGAYLVWSLIGGLPDLILEVLIGENLDDFTSPVFLISVSLRLLTAVAASVIYYFIVNKRKKRK